MMECPKCHLPTEEDAWQCDGCGYTFRQDYAVVRSELQAKLKTSRTIFWVTLLGSFGLAGLLVYLALQGFTYISVPLAIALVGGIGHAAHRTSRLRDHLRSLDRRHVPLPAATAQPGAGARGSDHE
jgi:hypothetical protein